MTQQDDRIVDSQDQEVDLARQGLHLFDLDAIPWEAPRPRPGPSPDDIEAGRRAIATADGVAEKWLLYPEPDSVLIRRTFATTTIVE